MILFEVLSYFPPGCAKNCVKCDKSDNGRRRTCQECDHGFAKITWRRFNKTICVPCAKQMPKKGRRVIRDESKCPTGQNKEINAFLSMQQSLFFVAWAKLFSGASQSREKETYLLSQLLRENRTHVPAYLARGHFVACVSRLLRFSGCGGTVQST